MIDQTTGGLTLSQTLRFRAGDTLETIKTRCAAASLEVADMQTGWQWLTVRNLRAAEEYFILSVGFKMMR